MRRLRPGIALALVVTACAGTLPDASEVTARFIDCLERNGIEAENVSVELDDDGTLDVISLVVLDEGDVAYEPAVRLSCTEEVEAFVTDR